MEFLLFGLLQATTVVVVLLGVQAASEAWRAAGARERLAVVGLVLLALAWRLAAPAGPHDINARSVQILGSGMQVDDAEYGWGRTAMWRVLLLSRWTGLMPLDVLNHATALASALSVGVFVVWLRVHDHPWTVAATAGLLVAVDPLLARFGHTDAPQIHELLPWFVALAAWTAHTREPAWRHALLGGASLGLAATMRPESVLLLPVALVVAWAQGRPLPLRERATQVGLAWAAVPALWQVLMLWLRPRDAALGPRAGWSSFAPADVGLSHWIAFQDHYTPWLLSVAVAVGALAAPGRGVRRLGWLLAYLALGVFVPETSWSTAEQDMPLLTRHQLRAIPFAAILAGFAANAVGSRVSWRHAGLVAGLALVGLRLTDQRVLTTPYTIHTEYRFYAEAVRSVPRGCAILSYRTDNDTGLVPPIMEHPGSSEDGSAFLDERTDSDPLPACAYWYRSALCALDVDETPTPAEACADFEARHVLEPVAETTLRSVPWLFERHTVDPVPVGLYRIVGPRAD